MSYYRLNYFQALGAVRKAVGEMGLSDKVATKLIAHIWVLDNSPAAEMADMIRDNYLHGKQPDFKGSLVMKRCFNKALQIIEG